MKRRVQLFVFYVVILQMLSIDGIAADSIGKVIALQGSAKAMTGEKTRNLILKSNIYLNDKVVTEDSSKIQILFNDDSIISQGAKSEMTIDKYVYTPRDKESVNSSLKFIKGVFRVVTGKITEMNPERFKVRTKMATIGIRGCEIGFRISMIKEDIYVLQLPKGDSIIIKKSGLEPKGIKKGRISHKNILQIFKEGVKVAIVEGEGLKERPITLAEARQIIEDSSPDPKKEGDSDNNKKINDGQNANHDKSGHTDNSMGNMGDKNANKPAPGNKFPVVDNKKSGNLPSLDIVKNNALLPPPPPPPDELLPPPPPPPQDNNPPPSGSTGPVTMFTPKGGGTGWEWGIWETDGKIDTVDFYPTANVLSPGVFQSIAHGAVLYNLSGLGSAAAVVRHNATTKILGGTCNLNVQVGKSVTPNWRGIFGLNNIHGDNLNFEANGTMKLNGQLIGNTTVYSLQVNGITFDRSTITAESIDGKLVGSGSGVAPIKSAVGNFNFDHGGAATVSGGYGTDLN